MKRIAILISAVALAVLGATTLASGASSATNPHQKVFTLVIEESEATLTPADFFSNLAQNTQASEDAPIYRDGSKVGLAETVITVTRAEGDDVAAMIECSIELPEGNLLFNGSVHLADLAAGADVPVVGGTGSYAGASGTVEMLDAEGSTFQLNFDFSTK